MGLEAKRILAFILCGIILMWWMSMQAPPPESSLQTPSEVAGQVSGAAGTVDTVSQGAQPKNVIEQNSAASISQDSNSNQGGNLEEKTPSKEDASLNKSAARKAEIHTLENEDLRLELSSRGGYVESVHLKNYRQQLASREQRQVAPDLEEQVDLTWNQDAQAGGVQFNFLLGEQRLHDNWVGVVKEYDRRLEMDFGYLQTPVGRYHLSKSFRLPERGFLVDVEVRLRNVSNQPVPVKAYASMGAEFGATKTSRYHSGEALEVAAMVNDRRLHESLQKIERERYVGNAIPWAGVMDRYFLSAMIPAKGTVEAVHFDTKEGDRLVLASGESATSAQVISRLPLRAYLDVGTIELGGSIASGDQATQAWIESRSGERKLNLIPLPEWKSDKMILSPETVQSMQRAGVGVQRGRVRLEYPQQTLAASEDSVVAMQMFLGPKRFSDLTVMDRQLEYSLDLGDWIGVISRPLLRFLNSFYQVTGNYGWAIILLTLIVRLLLFPLTHIQYKSMKRIQQLKPHLDAIRDKYKDNKEELTREMIALYKREKVNPAGSCFPLVLQMPVFFALYRVLYNAVELRHAPFGFWLQDLSAQDPFYITPVMMGLAMWLQQKMTPNTGMDPNQEMMMKIMPIMFSVFMLWLPSGLVVYIFVSTMLGLLQQWWMTRQVSENKAAA